MHKFTSAVILAAGNGTRFESDIKKQYITVGGVPAVVRCMQTFEACPLIDEIVLVGDMEELRTLLSGYTFEKLASVVGGGETRQESALRGFDAISEKAKYVAIHDAARCLVTNEIIEDTVRAAYQHRAAAAAEKTVDTVKRADRDGFISDTLDREYIWLVKTPQVFHCDVYRVAAYMAKKEKVTATDDSMLCERLGFSVKLVECGSDNIKLTHPQDLLRAEAILNMHGREG
ncbi:MAG: 2-C-methyl-D-erythritol 4-phosphate cytidylyltransferase [Clostridiales bacterium]|nr:2-C-methyl-D-erythritol 4-phosphate cytidylyltransferase [Clostridiales bacterium]